jgi:hypothetical protein
MVLIVGPVAAILRLGPDQLSGSFDLENGVDALGTFLELDELLGIGFVEDADAMPLDAGQALQAHARGEHKRRMGVTTEVVGAGGGETGD